MPRIPNYVRLRESESQDLDMLGGFFKDAGVLPQEQHELEGANSDCHDGFEAAQKYQNPLFEQQLKQEDDVNDSKTSSFQRSLSHRSLSSMEGSKDVKEAPRMAKSGELKRLASSWDSGESPELAMSPSGRWQVQAAAGGRGTAQLERKMSGKWKASDNDQLVRGSSPLRELFQSPSRQTAAGGKRAASSIQRIVSIHKNREITVQPSKVFANERDNFSPARRAWFAEDVGKSSPARRLQRQQTARFTELEKNLIASENREGEGEDEDEEDKPSPPRKLQRQQTGRFTDRGEKGGDQNEDQLQNTESTVPKSISPSKKIVDSQRSFSMRETLSCGMDIDGLLEDPSRRKSSAGAAGVKARVSFSHVVSSTIPDRENAGEAQRVDSPSSTAIRFQARLLSAATRSQPLRYNYEQPGFVERKSTDGAYSKGGGGKFSRRKEEKENLQQPPLSRTFSTFSATDKATYRRVASALPLSTPKNMQPTVVECVSCGKGLGIVVQGFSAGEASSFCKGCKPAGGAGGNLRIPALPYFCCNIPDFITNHRILS
ncbi:hypothetical protein R1sor_007539 [Riccia sorocarpa]|uniref:Uncharacterized protein n=1 Tax=Riccia sorocarpa TaxID=122646 RepID=A0ABD3HQS4_9MARC